jgi:hypothetical protein
MTLTLLNFKSNDENGHALIEELFWNFHEGTEEKLQPTP